MEHKESDRVKVYHTTDYGRFKLIIGNRPLNEMKIKKIMRDIADGIDVLRYYPIQVFERENKLEVKDGQHRFEISKKLGRAVFYILMKDDRTMLEVAKVNSNVEKWKNPDFLNSHIATELKEYEVLRDFMEKYKLGHTLAVRLLSSGTPGGDRASYTTADQFQRGLFKATYLTEATALAEACSLFKDFRHWKSSTFFTAVSKVMKFGVADIIDIASNYEKYRDELKPQPGYKEYIANLQLLFGKGKHKVKIIYEDKKPEIKPQP